MKAKVNEVALPPEVKRGRIDLTARRAKAGLASPMTQTEKEIIEKRLATALNEAVSSDSLMRAHEASLKATLGALKQSRKELRAAANNSSGGSVEELGESIDILLPRRP